MNWRRKLLVAVSSLAVLAAVLLAGCSNPASVALSDTGRLILRVNPEIEIAYDQNGNVLELTGKNADGEKIVSSYTDYAGQSCETVLRNLVQRIGDAGYFAEEIDGNGRNIVIQIEPGSILPEQSFLSDMSNTARDAVKGFQEQSGVVTIDEKDYDPAYAKNGNASPYITEEKAREIALTQAGIDDAVFVEKEYDHDDGTPVFELDFVADGVEYEYEIHAATGAVLKAEHEPVRADKTPVQSTTSATVPAAVTNAPASSSAGTASSANRIGLEKAKTIALNHANVSSSDARFTTAKLDYDDGRAEYELEFTADGVEYDYEIHAVSGQILKSERETIRRPASSAEQNVPKTTAAPSVSTNASANRIGLEKAKTIALNHANVSSSDARFTTAKLDYDDGIAEYELDFTAGGVEYDYEIHAVSGQILKSERETIRRPASSAGQNVPKTTAAPSVTTNASANRIGLEKAKTIALNHANLSASNVRFTDAKLDYDDGRSVYELEFVNAGIEYEYVIHAVSGQILEAQRDRDD